MSSPDEIQAEIAEARADLEASIDELSDRLDPARLVHEAADTARATARRGREAAGDVAHRAMAPEHRAMVVTAAALLAMLLLSLRRRRRTT